DELIDSALAAQPADASFEVELGPGVPPIQSDFVQIERALANLLDNARRFSAGQPILIQAEVVEDWVTIRVVDRGPGIAAADAERIFEPFYRAAPWVGEPSPHPGSGLGLAIAKGFVEANGGEISVASDPGEGTSFAVRL